jgi:hypothetical protein
MAQDIIPGGIYRHFKNNLYQVIAVAEHTETGEKLVIYQALYGTFGIYARPIEMFTSEVDHMKYPAVKQRYRFELVNPEREAAPQAEEKPSPASYPTHQTTNASKTAPDVTVSSDAAKGSYQAASSDVNPKLLDFFDAEDLQTKYNILVSMRDEIDDTLIDNMAVGLDIVIPDGELMDRYDELKRCIRTKQQYELNR